MDKVIFVILAIIFFYFIARNTGYVRLMWFFTGMIFFQDRIVLFESPTIMTFPRFLIYTLLLIELSNPFELYIKLKQFPLIKSLIVLMAGILCIAIFDFRHSIFLNVYRSMDDFIQSFFLIFLCYINLSSSIEWEKLVKSFLTISIILCVYGFYVFLTKSNPYDAFISKIYASKSSFDVYTSSADDRFRVNSFVSHPIYYGYLSGILLLLSFYGLFYLPKLKRLCLLTMPLIFVNLILSNSRTPIISTFLGLLCFFAIALNKKTKFNIFVCGLFVCFALSNVPLIQDKIDRTLDIFESGGSKTVGSTVDMRQLQLQASYKEFLKKPIFGNGFYYINEDLGWDKNPDNRTSDEDFEGFESYIYHLLIEEGLIGILTKIIFFMGIIKYYLSKISFLKEFSALGLAVLIMFLTFIIGTGAVDCWYISMGILGITIKYIQLKEREVTLFSKLVNFLETEDI